MATKNISRSALEGGRVNHNKWDRRESHRKERSRFRGWKARVTDDPDYADERGIQPRPPVRKEFTDKLGPAYGWLASRCGRPWDEVYSELSKLFDTRKLSAWHIVHQHMLPEVDGARSDPDFGRSAERKRFVIDEDGILRDRGVGMRRYTRREPQVGPTKPQVANRVGKRRVKAEGAKRYWMLPDGAKWVRCISSYHCWRHTHHLVMEPYAGKHVAVPYHAVPKYKKSREFTKGEYAWWGGIRQRIREAFAV